MSTLKTTNLQHPSAGSPAIVLDADGDATYAGVHDFSAATVTGAPQGLTHINTTTFSAVSSVSLDNVFTSTYANYKVMTHITAISSDGTLQMKLRVSSSDNSVNYYTALGGSNQSGSYYAHAQANASLVLFGKLDTGAPLTATTLDIYSPQLSVRTAGTMTNTYFDNSSTFVGVAGGFGHDNTGSFDGLTVSASAGNITGTIRIYGYKNS
jgi:hypothetical protein